MTAPLIGITTYPANDLDRYDLPANYVDAVRRAGGDVVLLPPGVRDPQAMLAHLDGVVLSGGGDLDPATYGGEGHETIYLVDAGRDEDEIRLARLVVEARVPTLAICRGHQVVNVALGGTLEAHLPDVVGTDVLHRIEPQHLRGMAAPTPHVVHVEPSRLADILGTPDPEPMSWHHQAVVEPGEGMHVVARAPDGTIEATEHDDHDGLVSVQWHPEITAGTDPSQQRLFDALVAGATGR